MNASAVAVLVASPAAAGQQLDARAIELLADDDRRARLG